MVNYTTAEKVDMILVYGQCNKNALEASREYARQFPDRIAPSVSTYQRLVRAFTATGSVDAKKRNKYEEINIRFYHFSPIVECL